MPKKSWAWILTINDKYPTVVHALLTTQLNTADVQSLVSLLDVLHLEPPVIRRRLINLVFVGILSISVAGNWNVCLAVEILSYPLELKMDTKV